MDHHRSQRLNAARFGEKLRHLGVTPEDGQRRQRLNSRRFGGKSRHFGVIPGDGQWGQRLSEDSFRLNNWAVTEGKRLSDHGGQWTFGVSEGVAPAPYSATRSRRAMYFWGLRGGSTGSLLCNAIRRLRRRKRKTKRFWFVTNKRWRFPIRVVHFQSYSIEGQSDSYCRQVCLCQLNAYGLWEVKILQIKAEDLM
jgi:hypothetical protein